MRRATFRVLSRGQFGDVAISDIEFPYVFSEPHSTYALAILLAGVQNEITVFVNTHRGRGERRGRLEEGLRAEAKVTGCTIKGDDIFLITYEGAPRYKILTSRRTIRRSPTRKVLVPQSDVVIQSCVPAKDALYVQDLDGGIARLRKVTPDGRDLVDQVADGRDDRVDLCRHDARRRARFTAELGAAAGNSGRRGSGAVTDTKLVAKPAIDVSPYASTRIFATAKDGTKVPVSVVYRKDMKRDGSAPAMIDAYGSYGINSDRLFRLALHRVAREGRRVGDGACARRRRVRSRVA